LYRVIELGHIVAGPTAGLILSEMGFEVIKVERPETGDISRHLTGQSAGSFPYYNRNKKSLTLNLKSSEGKKILVKLMESADIVIDNYSADFMKNLNLTYEELKKINKGLIYVTIRGYGRGKNENRKSLDYPIEIDSGIAFMNGLKDRPMRVGASLVDMFAASMAVIGIYQALMEREKTGEGKNIDASLFPSAMFMIGQHISTYQILKKELLPINEAGFAWGIYDFFKIKNQKEIFIAVTTDEQWVIFSKAFNISEDVIKKYSKNEIRFHERDTLIPYLETILLAYDSMEISEILDKNQIVYSYLRKPWDLLEDPDTLEMMNKVMFKEEQISLPSVPVSLKKDEFVPELGQHNFEVLQSLGYSKNDIERFIKEKIV
jgi:crotonobetainyl-CoA:carnitine CoA-transferase CaiB-like acyl-CoA transferase